jgi:hypothetical protein
VDTVETFDSQNLLAFDTLEDRTGWTVDGQVFPENGVDGNQENKIRLSRSELQNLSPGDYYFRIIPRVDQFWAQIDVPAEGQVYVGTTVDVSGTVIIVS